MRSSILRFRIELLRFEIRFEWRIKRKSVHLSLKSYDDVRVKP